MGLFSWLDKQFLAPSYLHLDSEQMNRLHQKRKAEHATEMKRLQQAKELTEMDREAVEASAGVEKAELKTVAAMGKSYYDVLGEKKRTTKAIEQAKKSYKKAIKGR